VLGVDQVGAMNTAESHQCGVLFEILKRGLGQILLIRRDDVDDFTFGLKGDRSSRARSCE
jgi:hypothetical protein